MRDDPSRGTAAPLSALFQPLTVGSTAIRNRFVMSAMTRCHSPGGSPTEEVGAYYRRRAEGEVGLIITEGVGIDHPAAVDHPRIPVMTETSMQGWRRVTNEVHAAGGTIFPQLWHQGPLLGALTGEAPEAQMRPSGLWGHLGAHSLDSDYVEIACAKASSPMNERDIADIVEAYARSSRLAMKAGFDGIAIHGGHGYLIDSFLWEETNRREDCWGGDLVRRGRFAVEVIRAIRRQVGAGVPILFRLSQHKSQDYAARIACNPDELGAVLGPLADAGVDIFDASARRFWEPAFEGSPLNLAAWAKRLTGKRAMMIGSVGIATDLEANWRDGSDMAENVRDAAKWIASGAVDFLGVGRAVLSDPTFVQRVRAGLPPKPFDKSSLTFLH